MSQLLLLKTLNNDYITRNVRTVEKYVETHTVKLLVLFEDSSVLVYDNNTLLLNIRIGGIQ